MHRYDGISNSIELLKVIGCREASNKFFSPFENWRVRLCVLRGPFCSKLSCICKRCPSTLSSTSSCIYLHPPFCDFPSTRRHVLVGAPNEAPKSGVGLSSRVRPPPFLFTILPHLFPNSVAILTWNRLWVARKERVKPGERSIGFPTRSHSTDSPLLCFSRLSPALLHRFEYPFFTQTPLSGAY